MYNIDNKKLSEKLMDENVRLKMHLKQYKEKIEDYEEEIYELKTDISVNETKHKKELEDLQVQLKALKSGEELKDAYEYIEYQKDTIASLEEIIEEYRKKENFSDKERIHCLELKLEELKKRTEKNPFGAGRKKDTALEEYLLECWRQQMKDREIIGSEYKGHDGKKKIVAQASYYRAKKRLHSQK